MLNVVCILSPSTGSFTLTQLEQQQGMTPSVLNDTLSPSTLRPFYPLKNKAAISLIIASH